MKGVATGISVLVMAALLMTAAACGQAGPAPNAGQTPSSGAGVLASVPPNLPMPVRSAAAMTRSVM